MVRKARLDAQYAMKVGSPLAAMHGFRVCAVRAADRKQCEEAIASAGLPLPLHDLIVWHSRGPGPRSTLCLIHDDEGRLRGAFAVQRYPSNALPFHAFLRVEHLGEAVPEGSEPAVAASLRHLAQRTPRVLRLAVEVHDRDRARRLRIGAALRAAGFMRRDDVRMYQHTLAIDLTMSEEDLLATFSARARRELRRAGKFPLGVVELDGNLHVPVLDELLRETFERTGGAAPVQHWGKLTALAKAAPTRLRLFGMTLAEEGTAPRLVAFARIVRHGTFAVYETAASTRLADRRVPMMYPIIWESLAWARDTGATWFDFGGVTAGTSDTTEDPVGGISEFKRNFGGELLEVGEDWSLDVAPVRERLAGSLGRAVAALRRQGG